MYLPNMMSTPMRKTKAWNAGWLTGQAILMLEPSLKDPSSVLLLRCLLKRQLRSRLNVEKWESSASPKRMAL